MPFVSNGTAFVTGDVPEKDLKHLNGSREEYSRRTNVYIGLGILAVFAFGVSLNIWRPFGANGSAYVFIAIMVVLIIAKPFWELNNPRQKNRRVWGRYFWSGRLHEAGYFGYDIVMSPNVVANIDVVEKQVAEFLSWYSEQSFGPFGPVMEADEAILAELRRKLESGVGAILNALGVDDTAAHVDTVLGEARRRYLNTLTQEANELQEKFEAFTEELRGVDKARNVAFTEQAYQRQALQLRKESTIE